MQPAYAAPRPLAAKGASVIRTVTLRDMVKTVDWIAGLIKS
jgi:hypothetical protein